MNYLSIFIVSFIIALSGALAPGPLLAIVVAESPKQGFKTGPLIILGHTILETLMIVFLLLGFSKFINSHLIIKIIAFLGGSILIWFGIKFLTLAPSLKLEIQNMGKKYKNLPLLGITMSLANPYWTVWWLTIGWGLLLTAQKTGFIAILFFFLGHILADFSWYSIVSLSITRGKKFISQRTYRGILFICGVTLLGFGTYFVFTSLR